MAICTRVGRICSGTVGMCSRVCSAWAARRVSRRRSTTRSGLASAHGQTLCGSWWYHNQLPNQVAQSRSGRSVARRTCSTARGSRRLTGGSYSSSAKSGLCERASIRARCSRCRWGQALTSARTSWSWRLEGTSPSAPSAMAMSRSMSESVICSSRRRSGSSWESGSSSGHSPIRALIRSRSSALAGAAEGASSREAKGGGSTGGPGSAPARACAFSSVPVSGVVRRSAGSSV